MEAVLLIGIQGTGKSSFYRQRFFDTHVRLSLDMLRTRNRERILFEACLAARQPLVVDNTNVTAAERARYLGKARAAGFRVLGYYFESGLEDALRRNQQRQGKGRIPVAGVIATHRRLQPPALSEGFDELFLVTLDEAGEFRVEPFPGG
ncbi:MAG: AAA family ATPase [Myxococcaceae bacterium]